MMVKTTTTRVPTEFIIRLENMYADENTRTKRFKRLNKELDKLLFGKKI